MFLFSTSPTRKKQLRLTGSIQTLSQAKRQRKSPCPSADMRWWNKQIKPLLDFQRRFLCKHRFTPWGSILCSRKSLYKFIGQMISDPTHPTVIVAVGRAACSRRKQNKAYVRPMVAPSMWIEISFDKLGFAGGIFTHQKRLTE